MREFFEAVDAGAYNGYLLISFVLLLAGLVLFEYIRDRRELRKAEAEERRDEACLRYGNAMSKAGRAVQTRGPKTPEAQSALVDALCAWQDYRETGPGAIVGLQGRDVDEAMRLLEPVTRLEQ